MKKRLFALLILSIVVIMAGCGECKHEFSQASCIAAATCTKCGQTVGEALGHDWKDATCTTSAICERCGQIQGEPLGHDLKDATCTDPAMCIRCNATEGTALGHEWIEASCVAPKTCSVCAETEGEALGHTIDSWTVIVDSTCSECGVQTAICTVCNETVEDNVPQKDHTPTEWTVTEPATKDKKGTRVKTCKACGIGLETEEFEMTLEELEKQYKKQCSTISYQDLQRNPGDNKGKQISVSGSVFQVISEAKSALNYSLYFLRANGNLYLLKIDNYGAGSRILEKDHLKIWGEVGDLYTYETIRGNSNTVPTIIVEYYE